MVRIHPSRLPLACRPTCHCWGYTKWCPFVIQRGPASQQTQTICITFVQCWTNVGPTLHKCYTNALCLLGYDVFCVGSCAIAAHWNIWHKCRSHIINKCEPEPGVRFPGVCWSSSIPLDVAMVVVWSVPASTVTMTTRRRLLPHRNEATDDLRDQPCQKQRKWPVFSYKLWYFVCFGFVYRLFDFQLKTCKIGTISLLLIEYFFRTCH